VFAGDARMDFTRARGRANAPDGPHHPSLQVAQYLSHPISGEAYGVLETRKTLVARGPLRRHNNRGSMVEQRGILGLAIRRERSSIAMTSSTKRTWQRRLEARCAPRANVSKRGRARVRRSPEGDNRGELPFRIVSGGAL
jgi:hypothetical protein